MNPVIEQIYTTDRVTDAAGNKIPTHSNIEKREGLFLAGIIQADPRIRKTLEIGFAQGLSSLFICSALAGREGAAHTILDPNQMTQWKGVGIENMRRAGFSFYTLIQEYSQFALPRLAQLQPASFDFIFIDGWHTFDHTLLDIFYANLLLKVGGYMAIDDCTFPAVARAVHYLSKYPAYEMVSQTFETHSGKNGLAVSVSKVVPKFLWPPRIKRKLAQLTAPSMIAFKKVAEDTRDWDWYADF